VILVLAPRLRGKWGERLSPHYRAYHAPFGLQAMQVPHLASRPFDMSSLQREMRGMDSEGGWWPGKVNVETVSTQEMCSTWPNVREAMATRLISPCHVASSSGGDGRAKLTFGPLDGGTSSAQSPLSSAPSSEQKSCLFSSFLDRSYCPYQSKAYAVSINEYISYHHIYTCFIILIKILIIFLNPLKRLLF